MRHIWQEVFEVMVELELKGRVLKLDHIPACPKCGKTEANWDGPHPVVGFEGRNLAESFVAYITFRCGCAQILVAGYAVRNVPFQGVIAELMDEPPDHHFRPKQFESPIPTISTAFCAIYNEALHAEVCGLNKVCGSGYRKALEFLIKDYLIHYKHVENRALAEEIATTPLASCIDKFIDDRGIQDTAHRAAWLGNDETHYVRKWTDADIKDLKDLIEITVSWIALHIRLRGHLQSMPTNKPTK